MLWVMNLVVWMNLARIPGFMSLRNLASSSPTRWYVMFFLLVKSRSILLNFLYIMAHRQYFFQSFITKRHPSILW